MAEECVLMQRRPDGRQTKARHRAGGGLEAGPRDARGERTKFSGILDYSDLLSFDI